jgi:hypothetical protein
MIPKFMLFDIASLVPPAASTDDKLRRGLHYFLLGFSPTFGVNIHRNKKRFSTAWNPGLRKFQLLMDRSEIDYGHIEPVDFEIHCPADLYHTWIVASGRTDISPWLQSVIKKELGFLDADFDMHFGYQLVEQ